MVKNFIAAGVDVQHVSAARNFFFLEEKITLLDVDRWKEQRMRWDGMGIDEQGALAARPQGGPLLSRWVLETISGWE